MINTSVFYEIVKLRKKERMKNYTIYYKYIINYTNTTYIVYIINIKISILFAIRMLKTELYFTRIIKMLQIFCIV